MKSFYRKSYQSNFISLAVFFIILEAATISSASFDPADPFGENTQQDHIKASTVLDRNFVRPGETFRIAVVMDIDKKWHSYANPKGPGAGAPSQIKGRNQKGFSFSAARYLPGEKLVSEYDPEDWVYAYKGKVPVFLEVTTLNDLTPAEYSLEIDFYALACNKSCVEFKKDLTVSVNVKSGDQKSELINKELFKDFEKAQPPPADSEAEVETTEGRTETTGEPQKESGIDILMYEARSTEDEGINSGLMAIFLGFIAGLLLNVMPCVLPVLSIKITSLVSQAHEESGKVFRLGLSFAAGIISVFLVLAFLAATAGLSWGGLFQSSTFNIIMIGLIFVFSLGMFDIYIISVAGGKNSSEIREGYLGSFYKGVLATFLATPCSGPFLGATLAWVLSQNWVIIFLVFTSIGLGMAAPYVILSASPGLLRFIPRPGNWMVTFKHMMGFILLATVVYLFTFLKQELFIYTLGFCFILALGAYIWGRFAHFAVPVFKRWVWRSIVLVLVGVSGVFVCTRPVEKVHSNLLAELEKHMKEKTTVAVKFTADWCPNCKYVEEFVLKSKEVTELLEEKNAVIIPADITHATNESTSIQLRDQLGSKSIPFLAIFPGDDHFRPYVLRDLYTKNDVLAILEKCP